MDNRTKSKVAEFLKNQIDMCGKAQNEIAYEIGYNKPNIITMFKQGLTKLPIVKVGPMAKAIGVDPARLMRLVLEEYMPDTWGAIQETVGFLVTENEREFITTLRSATKDKDPKLSTTDKKKLRTFLSDLK